MTAWIKHNGDEPPSLAPAALVELQDKYFDSGPILRRASKVAWESCEAAGYLCRVFRDPDGVPYCSVEGLEDWAEYVATDEDGEAYQFGGKPYIVEKMFDLEPGCPAPSTYRHPGDWRESLMRVWRP